MRSFNASAHVVAIALLASAPAISLGDTLRVPGDFPTIQAAIDASVDGDQVLVADGTYSGPGNRDIDFGGRAIEVRSANGAGACVIDVQADDADPARAFHFHSGETGASVVEGFTVRNGFMVSGGAVLCELASGPEFRSCVFEGNTAWGVIDLDGGGAVYNLGSSPTFIGCAFTGNHTEANALYTGGGAMRNQAGSAPVLAACTFVGNTATGPDVGAGGAVYNNVDSNADMSDCVFEGNQADWEGAVSVWISSGATLTNCEFRQNVAIEGAGGAIGYYGTDVPDGAGVMAVGCVFTENTAQGGHGGAIYCSGGLDLVLIDCDFIRNTTNDGVGDGGAMVANAGATATVEDCRFVENTSLSCCGAVAFNAAFVEVRGSDFVDNVAEDGAAGGALVTALSIATFTDCRFMGNESTANGGGLRISAPTTVTNCLFAHNTAPSGAGVICAGGNPELINCTLALNEAGSNGGAIRTTNPAMMTNCVLAANLPDEISELIQGSVNVTYSNVEGGRNGEGNIDADPLFVDPNGEDFALAAGSPCIDAADNTALPDGVLTDLAGNSRFVDDPGTADTGVSGGAGGNAIVDMGAFELQSASCAADFNGDGSVDTRDVLAFLNAWNAQDPASDCDGNGAIDTRDVLCFLNLWNAGC